MIKKFLYLILAGTALMASDIRILTPYYGSIRNDLTLRHMDDPEDTAPLGGLYFQWIRPEKFQWNLFAYRSNEINYSDITGMHFVFDFYPGRCPHGGLLVTGAGFDYILIETNGNVAPALSDFRMTNRVYAPYFRFGRYIDFGSGMKKFSLLPWGGIEWDLIRGSLGFNMNSPGMPVPVPVDEEIRDNYAYAIAGFNGKAVLWHFLELSAKYYRKFSLDGHQDLDVFSGMVNIYINRNWGFSYRYKRMEVSVSKNIYHMGGPVFIF